MKNQQLFTSASAKWNTPKHVMDLVLNNNDDVSTIRRWLKKPGALPPCSRFGRRRYWRRQALIDFIAEHESESGEVAPKRTRRTKRRAS